MIAAERVGEQANVVANGTRVDPPYGGEKKI